MSDKKGTEFWRDLKPITKVFQPDAVPEVYLPNIADDAVGIGAEYIDGLMR